MTQLNLPSPVSDLCAQLEAQGFAAYAVGGAVRDLLRGVVPKDFDVASAARPEDVQRIFRKTIPTGIEHGTVTVLLGGQSIEVTTFRSDGDYVDGRRPTEVVFGDNIELDLSRRDFCINAIAYRPANGQLVDPHGGQTDLSAGIIRCVGSAKKRFEEDGLRPLRALRFMSVLPNFKLDGDIEPAIAATREVFRRVAKERMYQELHKLLLGQQAGAAVRALISTGLMEDMVGRARLDDTGPVKLLEGFDGLPRTLGARFAALVMMAGVDAENTLRTLTAPLNVMQPAVKLSKLKRLKETVPDKLNSDALTGAAAFLATQSHVLNQGEIERHWLSHIGKVLASEAVQLHGVAGWLNAAEQQSLSDEFALNPPLSVQDLALSGGQLLKVCERPPGIWVGQVQKHLLHAVLRDPRCNTESQLAEMAKTLLQG